jgi:hypothetical protein
MKGYSNRRKGFQEIDERLLVLSIVIIGTCVIAPVIQQIMRRVVHHTTWLVWPFAFLLLLLAFVSFAGCIRVSEWIVDKRKQK